MFRFYRFIKVSNSETLINSLSNVWIGKLRLHANVARFDRKVDAKPSHARAKVVTPILNNYRIVSYFNKDTSYVNVAKAYLNSSGKAPRTNQEPTLDDGDDANEKLSLELRYIAKKVVKVYANGLKRGVWKTPIKVDTAYPFYGYGISKPAVSGQFRFCHKNQIKSLDDGDDANEKLSLELRYIAKKVLGLVVQYGVSNLWIWRIEGLRWIRHIHSMDTAYPSLQFLVMIPKVTKRDLWESMINGDKNFKEIDVESVADIMDDTGNVQTNDVDDNEHVFEAKSLSELPEKNCSLNTFAKLARAKPDKYSGEAGMSKDVSWTIKPRQRQHQENSFTSTLGKKLRIGQGQRAFLIDSLLSPPARLTRVVKPIPAVKVRRVSPKTKNHHAGEGQKGWRTEAELKKEPDGRNPNPKKEGQNTKKQAQTQSMMKVQKILVKI
ncbi:hypothetical protein Tco_1467195 [Tanacetum coccineum]